MGPGVRRDDDRVALHHGIANRSVLPPPLMSTAAKPIGPRPRLPQSPCSLLSNLLSRVHSSFAAPPFSGFSFYFIRQFSPAPVPPKMEISCVMASELSS